MRSSRLCIAALVCASPDDRLGAARAGHVKRRGVRASAARRRACPSDAASAAQLTSGSVSPRAFPRLRRNAAILKLGKLTPVGHSGDPIE